MQEEPVVEPAPRVIKTAPVVEAAPVVNNNTQSKNGFVRTTDEKRAKFNVDMRTVAQGLQANKNYTKIALNTVENKKWFKVLMYRLWDKQIDKETFINEGLVKYPYNAYEFSVIANLFAQLK